MTQTVRYDQISSGNTLGEYISVVLGEEQN